MSQVTKQELIAYNLYLDKVIETGEQVIRTPPTMTPADESYHKRLIIHQRMDEADTFLIKKLNEFVKMYRREVGDNE